MDVSSRLRSSDEKVVMEQPLYKEARHLHRLPSFKSGELRLAYRLHLLLRSPASYPIFPKPWPGTVCYSIAIRSFRWAAANSILRRNAWRVGSKHIGTARGLNPFPSQQPFSPLRSASMRKRFLRFWMDSSVRVSSNWDDRISPLRIKTASYINHALVLT